MKRKINMPDLGAIARAAKRVTMDDSYVSLDALRDQQAEDSRHMNQRIDTVSQRVDNLGSQLNQRIDTLSQKIDTQGGQVNQRIDQLNQRIDNLGQKMDTQFAQLNQTILQFLMGKQKE